MFGADFKCYYRIFPRFSYNYYLENGVEIRIYKHLKMLCVTHCCILCSALCVWRFSNYNFAVIIPLNEMNFSFHITNACCVLGLDDIGSSETKIKKGKLKLLRTKTMAENGKFEKLFWNILLFNHRPHPHPPNFIFLPWSKQNTFCHSKNYDTTLRHTFFELVVSYILYYR